MFSACGGSGGDGPNGPSRMGLLSHLLATAGTSGFSSASSASDVLTDVSVTGRTVLVTGEGLAVEVQRSTLNWANACTP